MRSMPLAGAPPLEPGWLLGPVVRHRRHATAVVLGAAAALCGLAALVFHFDAVPVLAGLLALAAVGVMLLRPELATLLVVLLLYINFPAILTQRHGLPEWLAGSFILLLGFPLLRTLVLRREPFVRDGTLLLMLAFLAVLVLSSVQAIDKALALTYVRGYLLEGLLLYWLVVNVIRDGGTLRRAIWTVLAVGSLLSVLCVYQDLTGSYTQHFGGLALRKFQEGRDVHMAEPRELRDKREKWDRAQGPVNEPNRFAQIMVVLVPLAVFMARTGRSRLARAGAVAAGLLIVAGVLVTLSRGAFVTLLVISLAMVTLRWIRPVQVLLLVLVLAVAAPVVTPFFFKRLQSITAAGHLLSDDRSQIQEADGAIRGRTTEMLAALHVFRDHPLLGVGPAQFPRFYFFDYSRNPDIKFKDIQKASRRAHSLYLEMAAETGAIGLGVFLAIVGTLMRRLWRARKAWWPDAESPELATAFWLCLLAYLCSAVFLHLSFQRYYWFLVALASVAMHVLQQRAARVRVAPFGAPILDPAEDAGGADVLWRPDPRAPRATREQGI